MTLHVRVGAASRPLLGEVECGDQFAVHTREGITTAVLADGLGHGAEAARAARLAADLVKESGALPLVKLLGACHDALRGSRGAAVTLLRCSARDHTLSHCGVGNVELVGLTRHRIRPITTPGIVGVRARRLAETTHVLSAGDLLVLHTDGVSSRLSLEPLQALDAQAAAGAVLRAYAKDHDDAACIVVRC
jgi:hypothetical protein